MLVGKDHPHFSFLLLAADGTYQLQDLFDITTWILYKICIELDAQNLKRKSLSLF